jgi:hypothetical protein
MMLMLSTGEEQEGGMMLDVDGRGSHMQLLQLAFSLMPFG